MRKLEETAGPAVAFCGEVLVLHLLSLTSFRLKRHDFGPRSRGPPFFPVLAFFIPSLDFLFFVTLGKTAAVVFVLLN